MNITDEKYNVIVIDPPWPIQPIKGKTIRAWKNNEKLDYATMTVDGLKTLQLPSAPNCHVYCWATHKYLPTTFGLFTSWGVRYMSTFVWHKDGGNKTWNMAHLNCEFAVYGRIGSPVFRDEKDIFACFKAPRTGHSRKPEGFYQMLRRVTEGPRLDMFNRRRIEGFDGWGDESPYTHPELDQTMQPSLFGDNT